MTITHDSTSFIPSSHLADIATIAPSRPPPDDGPEPGHAPKPVHVIGGGLAGCEAAWQIAEAGVSVILHEMRPTRMTEAHRTDTLAELVCSNSFRSDDSEANAVGVLHRELRALGSLILHAADTHQVPAGGALAVDRERFAAAVTQAIASHRKIQVVRETIQELPPSAWDNVIIATGPLTAAPFAEALAGLAGQEGLAFFDAIAPIVHRDSIDMSVAWFQSRYDKVGPGGTGADYINCPMSQEQYEAFVDALLAGETVAFRDWELKSAGRSTPYFDGCLPIEVMAQRGRETLRHGPMKPFGLTNAHQPAVKPYAVVQLRQDNALGTLYNIVGFQTKLKHGPQLEIFRTIPGLFHAEFARLGGIHRNSYLNAPQLLDETLRLKVDPRLRFAGQITGCEGYVESTAIGLLAGRLAAGERLGRPFTPPPPTTAMGALLNHITGGHVTTIDAGPRSFQPMNVNFGLFPPLPGPVRNAEGKRLKGPERAKARKVALSRRAAVDLQLWLKTAGAPVAPPR